VVCEKELWMKEELIELYKDALRLGHYIELENVANGMLPPLSGKHVRESF
jgi:hypothetical protein